MKTWTKMETKYRTVQTHTHSSYVQFYTRALKEKSIRERTTTTKWIKRNKKTD